MEPSYVYKAEVIRVIDGDTYEVAVDLGFHVHTIQHLRLEGINTPELNTPGGRNAKLFVESVLRVYGTTVTVRTKKTFAMTFNRYIAYIELSDGESMGAKLTEAGYTT